MQRSLSDLVMGGWDYFNDDDDNDNDDDDDDDDELLLWDGWPRSSWKLHFQKVTPLQMLRRGGKVDHSVEIGGMRRIVG